MSDATPAPSDAGVRRGWLLFAGLAATVVVTDQISKAWIDGSFPEATTHPPTGGLAAPTAVLGDLVRIAKTYNDGGIFGLFGAAAPILAVASVIVIGVIITYHARSVRAGPLLLTASLGLLLGGALGNFLDRIRYGYVIDFVDMGIGTWRWYTFNVADASISIAIVGLIGLSVLGDRPPPWRRAAVVSTPGSSGAR